MNPIQAVTQSLATLVLVSDIALLAGLVVFVAVARAKLSKFVQLPIIATLAKNGRILSFIVALTAMSGSLFFSEIAKFTPCTLCWYQRILMYPQVLLLGMSIAINDKKHIGNYCLGLSGLGMIIAAYHYYIQVTGNEFIPCSAVGYSVSCTQKFVMTYGYITIPLEALTGFIIITSLMLLMRASARLTKTP